MNIEVSLIIVLCSTFSLKTSYDICLCVRMKTVQIDTLLLKQACLDMSKCTNILLLQGYL